MKLTENFTLEEFIKSETARIRNIRNNPGEGEIQNLKRLCEEILQPVRNRYGSAIIITSGFRSKELNREIAGSTTSQHLKGEAADIISQDNKRLWEIILEMIYNNEIKVGQLIDEKKLSWIHISLPTFRHRNQVLHL